MTIAAVDIGGTKIAVGMVDENGQVLCKTETATNTNDYADGLTSIAAMLRQTAKQAGVEISGIGIGSTGPVNPFTGEFGDVDFLPGWRHKSPVADLSRMFNVRVALENDGDAAALAEAGWGVGKNKKRLIYVTIGTGIGGGIVLEGKPDRRGDGAHHELGDAAGEGARPPRTCGDGSGTEASAAGPAPA